MMNLNILQIGVEIRSSEEPGRGYDADEFSGQSDPRKHV